jgi:hypothetical protein
MCFIMVSEALQNFYDDWFIGMLPQMEHVSAIYRRWNIDHQKNVTHDVSESEKTKFCNSVDNWVVILFRITKNILNYAREFLRNNRSIGSGYSPPKVDQADGNGWSWYPGRQPPGHKNCSLI